MKKLFAFLAVGALFVGTGVVAQTIIIPQVTSVGPTDVFQDVVGGSPSLPTQYATAALITNVAGYTKVVPLTAFTLTFVNGQTYMLLKPAGTLATGTITFEPNPGDGAKECVRSTQTQTALTLQGNTGQTVASAITAMTANTSYCYLYSASTASWDPI